MPNSRVDQDVFDFDRILSELGVGKYQVLNLIILYLCISMDVLREDTYIFTTSDPSYRCFVPDCENSPIDFDNTWLSRALPFENHQPHKCERYVVLNSTLNDSANLSCNVLFDNTTEKCTSWVYKKGLSIVEDLEIACEDWKRSLVGSLNNSGQIFSFLISGFISDKYGRRNVLIIMIVLGGCIGILQSFSQNYLMFAILEFLTMSFGSGAYVVAYVMIQESLPLERRIYGSVILDVVGCSSRVLLGLLGWLSNSWRWFMRICDIPSLFAIAFIFILPESVRWLHAKGRGKECEQQLNKAAKHNGVNYSQGSLLELNRMSSETINISENSLNEQTQNDNFKSILNSRRLLLRLIVCAFFRFATVLTFDGLTLKSVNISIGDNAYLNYMLTTLIELPSIFIVFIILRFISRKIGMQIPLAGAGVCCIIYATVSFTSEGYQLIVYLLAKFFITISFRMTYIYFVECFPTNIRNSAVNFCAVVGRIGGALAPQFLLLEKVNKSLSMILFGAIPFVCALCVFHLPNTRNKKLPDTIAEAEQL